ncbi:hypothetical protein V9W64_00015 [Neisseria leonii]|uniref:Uncharacterized protein n=1 Tax=Neisseria leonii TaxID=2995413 RepID=A0A9X4E2I0_9NEIS|nr:hypothetical protein [Neisseria sp. 51.81]MDD9326761.1 hypothetical protein [Neisseria sp. 51.81]
MILNVHIVMLVAAGLPSAVLAYLMICRLNARKWKPNTPEPWAYLFMLGGALWTFYSIAGTFVFPTLGKLLMDLGACAFFGWNSWRISLFKRRRKQDK